MTTPSCDHGDRTAMRRCSRDSALVRRALPASGRRTLIRAGRSASSSASAPADRPIFRLASSPTSSARRSASRSWSRTSRPRAASWRRAMCWRSRATVTRSFSARISTRPTPRSIAMPVIKLGDIAPISLIAKYYYGLALANVGPGGRLQVVRRLRQGASRRRHLRNGRRRLGAGDHGAPARQADRHRA